MSTLLLSFVLFLATFRLTPLSWGESIEFPVSRDLWVSSAGGEEHGANGGAPRLKLKGYQEFSLLDFDLESLRGKKIEAIGTDVLITGRVDY